MDRRTFRRIQDSIDVYPMLLWCPACGKRHIDEGEFANKPHHTHACQFCGMVWRPARVNTVGVQFLPGFESEFKTDKIQDGTITGRSLSGKPDKKDHK